MIKAVIFDLDGTLIDSESHYVNGTIEWLSNCGIKTDYFEICKIIGITMEDTYAFIEKYSGLDRSLIIEKNTEYFTKINPLDFRKLLFDDVKQCLINLKKQGIKISICSASPKDYIKQFIDECGLNDYIDSYYSGDECINSKPNPEIYNKAISQLNIKPKDVLIVEDAPAGIESAKGSGAYVVARNDAKFGLNQDDALFIFNDLKELDTIILEINNGKYD